MTPIARVKRFSPISRVTRICARAWTSTSKTRLGVSPPTTVTTASRSSGSRRPLKALPLRSPRASTPSRPSRNFCRRLCRARVRAVLAARRSQESPTPRRSSPSPATANVYGRKPSEVPGSTVTPSRARRRARA
ncbi:MAG: hypothetical protein ACAI25_11425 [Planctomycetota bacterium]